jgi:PUA-domain protein
MSEAAPKIKKRHSLKRKETKKIIDEASKTLGEFTVSRVEAGEFEDGRTVYYLDGEVQLVRDDDGLYPTLNSRRIEGLPGVVVDMGAIPYVCNGADVMAPGITDMIGEFEEGDIVVVRDVRHNKALAVGKAMRTSREIMDSKKGKVIRNLHYVGDRLWDAIS